MISRAGLIKFLFYMAVFGIYFIIVRKVIFEQLADANRGDLLTITIAASAVLTLLTGVVITLANRISQAIKAERTLQEAKRVNAGSASGSQIGEIVIGADLYPMQPKQVTSPGIPDYSLMRREIRSWGWWLLIWGVIHLIGSGYLNAPWGVLLLLVGASSFYFREAPVFVVYGVTLAWAAVSNLTGGSTGWIIFALIQVYMAVRVFQQYFRFRHAQSIHDTSLDETERLRLEQRAGTFFPWSGCLLSALAGVGVPGLMVLGIVLESSRPLDENMLGLAVGFLIDFAVLGLAFSLASLLSGFRYKLVSILGLVASVLLLAGWVILVLFSTSPRPVATF